MRAWQKSTLMMHTFLSSLQILTMGALINCVELKESAKNCAIMASLTVHPRSLAREGSRLSGGGGVSSKCLAPEFLAKLLVRCTRTFAHQLEGDRPDQGEEEPSSPSPQGKYGSITSGPRGSDSTSLEVASKAQSMTPTAAQEGEGEELMSHTEGADLVLGGHCALLLGLLLREQERSRCGQRRRHGRGHGERVGLAVVLRLYLVLVWFMVYCSFSCFALFFFHAQN